MSRYLAFIALLAAALAASHTEAGPIAVVYDYLGAVLSFDKVAGEDGVVTAVDGLGSSLSLSREDETASVIDPVTTAGDAGWDFELKLEMMAGLGNGPGGWTNLDGYSIDDIVNVNQVYIDSAKPLYLVGAMQADDPIGASLLFGGDPFPFRGHGDWRFDGDDGTANPITGLRPELFFDSGTLTTITIHVGDMTVDDWFGGDRGTAAGPWLAGEVGGAITPTP